MIVNKEFKFSVALLDIMYHLIGVFCSIINLLTLGHLANGWMLWLAFWYMEITTPSYKEQENKNVN